MKLERHALSRLALPLKAFADRFAFGALIALSVGLLILAKVDVRVLETVHTRLSDLFVPVLALVTEPVVAARRIADQLGELAALRAENARLREQNRRLLEWQNVARRLAVQNAAFRQLLRAETEPAPTAVTARVVADAGGPFVQTVLVDAGADQGVSKGMAAVNERGLVGRVIEVGRRSARILLLTDFNSRIPAMVEPSRDQAILAGDNTLEPDLIFLPVNPRVAIGDRVVTSGSGGVLPPGLEIGVVSTISEDSVAVTPFVDWSRLEYLRLLAYAPVEPPQALAGPQREVYGPPPPPGFAAPSDAAPVSAQGHHADEIAPAETPP